MFHHIVPLSLAISIFSQPAQAQDAAWVNPPIAGVGGDYSNDLSWPIGSTQTLSWQSSFPTATIILNQQHLDATPRFITVVEDIVATDYPWVVNIGDLSLTGAETLPYFYLGVNVSDSNGHDFYVTAHYINITPEGSVASSSSTSSSTTSTSKTSSSTSNFSTSISSSSTSSSTSSASSSSTTLNLTGSSSSSSTPTPSNSSLTNAGTKEGSGLSTGDVAGISVGCTLVFIAFIVGLGYFYYRNRKLRRQLAQATTSGQHEGPLGYGAWKAELPVGGARPYSDRAELDPGAQVAEIGSGHESVVYELPERRGTRNR